MQLRLWVRAAVVALLVGFFVAAAMTLRDWVLNPANVFYDQHGTNWPIVAETALSWLWPAVITVFTIVAPLFFLQDKFGRR